MLQYYSSPLLRRRYDYQSSVVTPVTIDKILQTNDYSCAKCVITSCPPYCKDGGRPLQLLNVVTL